MKIFDSDVCSAEEVADVLEESARRLEEQAQRMRTHAQALSICVNFDPERKEVEGMSLMFANDAQRRVQALQTGYSFATLLNGTA